MPHRDPIRRKAYHRNYHVRHRASKRSYGRARLDRLNQIARDLKDVPCTDCGGRYPHWVMDFDHLRDKKFNVSRLIRYGSRQRLIAEIEKCEVVCSNCHRTRTWNRRLQRRSARSANSDPQMSLPNQEVEGRRPLAKAAGQ